MRRSASDNFTRRHNSKWAVRRQGAEPAYADRLFSYGADPWAMLPSTNASCNFNPRQCKCIRQSRNAAEPH